MDESKIAVEEPADPLGGWKTFSSLAVSAVISFGCCPAPEMIYYSLLLFSRSNGFWTGYWTTICGKSSAACSFWRFIRFC